MLSYLIRRVAAGFVLLWVSVTIIFLMLQAVPGDPAVQLLTGDGRSPSPEAVESLRAELGLDRPVWEQYISYLGGLLVGDFGSSFVFGSQVTELLGPRLLLTLELAVFALLVGVILGTAIGSLAARAGGTLDTGLTAILSVFISVPVYVVGALLIMVLSLNLGIFPAGGYTALDEGVWQHITQLILPVVTLSLPIISVVGRMARSSVLENAQQDWVRTARSWGHRPGAVFGSHVLRNSMTSVTSIAGLEAGALIGSTVLVERIFNLPGVGSLLIDAVGDRDYPVVQAIVVVVCVAFIILNIIVDVTYGFLDPRVRRKTA